MEVIFLPQALEDLDFWKRSGNTSVLKKVRALVEVIQETPFEGIGKPEALKHNYSGWWSRRISNEHRLVYRVNENQIIIAQLRFHYS
jgi:toxin YoeB